MANNNPILGLRPQPDVKGSVNTRTVPVSSSNAKAIAVGDPITVTAGQALSLADGATNATKVSGVVVRCLTDANKTVANIPASTDGYMVEATTDGDVTFLCTVAGTQFADDGTDNGKFYMVTDGTVTANTDGFSGDSHSKRQIDGATESATDGQFQVLQKSNATNNLGGVTGTEVLCKINPANYQSW